jgi:hypothetical protein
VLIRTRIDHETFAPFRATLDDIEDRAFVITLMRLHLEAEFPRDFAYPYLDIAECHPSVGIRLPRAE